MTDLLINLTMFLVQIVKLMLFQSIILIITSVSKMIILKMFLVLVLMMLILFQVVLNMKV